jgi:carnitine O-acetyltransferase
MDGNEYPNIQPSTFGLEHSLPRVPIPDLAAAGAQFLEWSAPLLSSEQLAMTRGAVEEFLAADSPARAGYARILEHDAKPGVGSWLDDFWRDRYLGRRVRTAINANFFVLLRDCPDDQYRRAADLIMGALDHKLAVDAERLPVTIQRGNPLSMEQHKYLFSSTRIPGIERDRARTPYTAEWPGHSRERHLLVLVDGHLFRLDVIGPRGVPHTLAELTGALKEIAGSVTGGGPGVGYLTSLDRPDWARVRERLLGLHPDNRETMDIVERALIGICLEQDSPGDLRTTCDELLAGDGGNRWFDKAISLVVFANGRAGLQIEHCKLDGATVSELVDSIMVPSCTEHERAAGARPQGRPAWNRLEFVLDHDLRTNIRRARESFDQSAGQTAGQEVDILDLGSDVPKRLGISPDGFAQIGFQLAHHRARGFLGATYESISTRRYHHGRTEAMRVLSPELVSFVAAMADPSSVPPARDARARTAAAKHVRRATECQAHHAPEQLIWELQLEARRYGHDSGLSIYESPGWLVMRDDFLSTSRVPSVNVEVFGFGATSGQCIGVGYQLLPHRFTIYLSAPSAIADAMARFAEELPHAVEDLAVILRGPAQGRAGNG